MTLAEGAVLDVIFEDETWGSTMTLDSMVTPQLDGTLRLGFAPTADVASLIGTTFRVFDWNGRLAAGDEFGQFVSGHQWDLSNLYTTGEVTLIPEPATLGLLAVGGLGLLGRRRRC